MGKTTTLRILLGLEDPTRGAARVFGLDSRHLPPEARAWIGYLPEGHHVYGWMTVKECGRFQAGFFSRHGDLLRRLRPGVRSERMAYELDDTLGEGWGRFRDMAIRSSVTSVLLALLTLAGARRMHFSWQRVWAWAAFVLAFNLAGLIAFRLVADGLVRVRQPRPQFAQ